MLLVRMTMPVVSWLAEAINSFFFCWPKVNQGRRTKWDLVYGKENQRSKAELLWKSSLDSWVCAWVIAKLFVFNWASNTHSCLTCLEEYMEQNKKPGVLEVHVKFRWGKLFSFTDQCDSSLLGNGSDSIFCCIGAHKLLFVTHHSMALEQSTQGGYPAGTAFEELFRQTLPWDGSKKTNSYLWGRTAPSHPVGFLENMSQECSFGL